MKKGLRLCLAVLVLLAWTEVGVAQQQKVPPEVWEKVQAEGVVRVIVGLDVPWEPEGKLSPQAVLTQRQAIAKAQDALLAELAGTTHRVTGRYETVPGLGLEVGPDAIAVLEHSARVLNVTEDRPLKFGLVESVPLVEAPQAWAAGFDGTGWVAAVLDTGVDKGYLSVAQLLSAPTKLEISGHSFYVQTEIYFNRMPAGIDPNRPPIDCKREGRFIVPIYVVPDSPSMLPNSVSVDRVWVIGENETWSGTLNKDETNPSWYGATRLRSVARDCPVNAKFKDGESVHVIVEIIYMNKRHLLRTKEKIRSAW
jgi:hypothetical protein